MPQNEAAWLATKHGPLQVKEAPYTEPGPGEILVRNRALAVNPVDWMLPYLGGIMFAWVKPPFILGTDLAGEVVAVGAGVDAVKPGDRVLAMAAGTIKSRARPAESAFQAYSIVLPRLTTVIPGSTSFEEASVIPLGIATAACGLFQKDLLALALPSPSPAERGQWVLIWGGATSVGCNAIQLARAAGYRVIATCSPKNFDYVRSLGADHALDYNSPAVVAELVSALAGMDVVGALAIGAGSTSSCMEVLAQCRGRKFVASCSSPLSFDLMTGDRMSLGVIFKLLPRMIRARMATQSLSRKLGVSEKFYDASSVVDNEIGAAIYRDYLGAALAAGAYRAAPPPRVSGHGLAAVQTAFEVQRRGVSAAKIVVTLD
jgi:NADPH:quinone reductase-like Zn-dependent oxidoreductase